MGFLIVYSGITFWQTVSKWKWIYLAIGAVLFSLRLSCFDEQAVYYLKALESNCWIFGVLGLGYRYLDKPGARLRYLSQAAYPVYIIHMFVLFAGAMIILPLNIHPVLKFIGITFFTFAGCLLIYEFILRRIANLRPLFGLKWQSKEIKPSKLQLPEDSKV